MYAIIDNTEVYLYATIADLHCSKEMKWPIGWPSYVTWEFLESQGFKVRTT